ncbi:MAG: nuclear transport factor 2 family protein [Acidimicrobiales bacterium]|nr:nuclear transport factor 2 family protein [Acidimicrobiales bacterium]
MRSTTEPSSAEIDGGPLAELVARYVEAVALFDRELYRSVWTDDAVWVVDGRGSFVGPDAITELYVELRGRQELAVQRVMSGRATADGDTGSGRWIIHSITRTDGKGEELVGVYDDRYRLEGASWRFVERAFRPLYRGPRDLPGRVWRPE